MHSKWSERVEKRESEWTEREQTSIFSVYIFQPNKLRMQSLNYARSQSTQLVCKQVFRYCQWSNNGYWTGILLVISFIDIQNQTICHFTTWQSGRNCDGILAIIRFGIITSDYIFQMCSFSTTNWFCVNKLHRKLHPDEIQFCDKIFP